MTPGMQCDLCGREIRPYTHFVVRIDVFADPAVEPMTTQDLQQADATMRKLLEQMKHMSAQELQDGVHRRFEYRICPACQPQFLANPLGKPKTITSANP